MKRAPAVANPTIGIYPGSRCSVGSAQHAESRAAFLHARQNGNSNGLSLRDGSGDAFASADRCGFYRSNDKNGNVGLPKNALRHTPRYQP
jgi:hypothetical protein